MNEGDIVPIYRNHQEETSFEGYAKLIRKVGESNTYLIDMALKEPQLIRKLGEGVVMINEEYARCKELMSSEMTAMVSFINTCANIINLKTKKRCLYNDLYSYIKELKHNMSHDEAYQKASYQASVLKTLLDEFPVKYITLYLLQTTLKDNETSSLFIDERWDVEFFPQKHPFKKEALYMSSFTTTRKIKVLVKEFPPVNVMSDYTNYDEKGFVRTPLHEFDLRCRKPDTFNNQF